MICRSRRPTVNHIYPHGNVMHEIEVLCHLHTPSHYAFSRPSVLFGSNCSAHMYGMVFWPIAVFIFLSPIPRYGNIIIMGKSTFESMHLLNSSRIFAKLSAARSKPHARHDEKSGKILTLLFTGLKNSSFNLFHKLTNIEETHACPADGTVKWSEMDV